MLVLAVLVLALLVLAVLVLAVLVLVLPVLVLAGVKNRAFWLIWRIDFLFGYDQFKKG